MQNRVLTDNQSFEGGAANRPVARLYLSIVGHQLMATLNPLLALPTAAGMTRVLLLVTTGKSASFGAALQTFLRHRTDCEVCTLPVSQSLCTDNDGNPPVQEVVAAEVIRHDAAEIYFNLAGGMNFQIAACTLVLKEFPGVRYLSPELHATRLYGADTSGKLQLQKELHAVEMEVEQLLELQGVPFKTGAQAAPSRALKQLLEKSVIALPTGNRLNMTVAGVTFDCIFNRANTLHLCKVMPAKQGQAQLNTETIRDFIGSVTSRRDFGELFHYQLLVLTSSPWAEERLKTECGGKAIVLPYRDSMSQIAASLLRQELKSFFQSGPKRKIGKNPPCHNSIVATGDRVLYTFLGRNIMPTLAAIWSHGATKTCLFYTPGDEQIEFYRSRLEQKPERLPSKVAFCPVSFHAEDLESFMPVSGPFEVNITPGTKEQAFFLARMALRHGGEVFSISRDELCSLTGTQDRAVRSPDITSRIDLTVDSPVVRAGCLPEGNARMKTLLQLFRAMQVEDDAGFSRFFSLGEHRFGPVGFHRQDNQFTVSYSLHGREIIHAFKTQPNNWFEELIGYVIATCGENDPEIRLGLKANWKQYVPIKHGGQAFRTESDVFAKCGSRYYLISCKAGHKPPQTKSAREIKSTALALDRMTIPLLATLHYSGQPKMVEGVYLFGHRTLTDAAAMKNLLSLAAQERSTTAHP